MNTQLFIAAVLGHFIGDYLLQSKWMALTKSVPGLRGVAACTVHVLIYTAAVCAMMGAANPEIVAAVAVPHWIIDRWSLGALWLRLIRGRTYEAALAAIGPVAPFEVAFFAVVYAVTDNTFHLLCLLATILWCAA